ncbi:MAG: leucine-rich repeat protein [Candidatus Methanoplasma sp.]|jgi:uncharacterized repeat protein (TIGR02543 family)|nr:leucine-rich repeat protein [Candidatus Methanoplasma sp.]
MDETRSKGVRKGTGAGDEKGKKNKIAIISVALAAAILCIAAVALIAYDGGPAGNENGAPGGSGGDAGRGGGEDLSAVTYSLSFDVDGGTPIAPQAVYKGEKAHKPSAPAKPGMDFAGWYRDPALSVPWSFDDKVTGNMVLYAKWASESRETGPTFKVSFVTGIAPALPDATGIASGSRMVAPPAPVMDGYRLNGWYKDEALTERWDFSTDRVTGDSTLYAWWVEVYAVRYHFPVAGVAESDWTVEETYFAIGDDFGLMLPEREPYAFGGWFLKPWGVNYGHDDLSQDNLDSYPDGTQWSQTTELDLYAYWEGTADIEYRQFQSLFSPIGYEFEAKSLSGADGAQKVVQEYYRGVPVTRIAERGFLNSAMTSMSLPDTITSIGNVAFSGCAALVSISLSNAITEIGQSAFYHCASLEGIVLPSNLQTIREGAFDGCSAIGELAIPSSMKSLKSGAFAKCIGIKKLVFAPQQTAAEGLEIGGGVFSGCSGIENALILPSGLKSIGLQAFDACINIPLVFIPNTVTTVGENAFPSSQSMTICLEATVPSTGWNSNWHHGNTFQENSVRPQ